ncbi:MAG: hypothetical protein HYV97_08040 [Bdellovibrio sp.]|nr:hypothetical protein [Bdellovibrio sp.]
MGHLIPRKINVALSIWQTLGALLFCSACGRPDTALPPPSFDLEQTVSVPSCRTEYLYVSSRHLDGTDSQGGSDNIWAVGLDGKSRPLTRYENLGHKSGGVPSVLASPVALPVGDRIAFVSSAARNGEDKLEGDGIFNLWSLSLKDGKSAPITNIQEASYEEWDYVHYNLILSSNERLFFNGVMDFENQTQLSDESKITSYEFNFRDSTLRTLAPSGPNMNAPNVSDQNSEWILASESSTSWSYANVIMISQITGKTRLLTSLTNAKAVGALFGPNQKEIIYISNRRLDGSDNKIADWVYNLWITDIEGKVHRPLTKFINASALSPRFSLKEKGERVFFIASLPLTGEDRYTNPRNIWSVKWDGTDLIPVTKHSKAWVNDFLLNEENGVLIYSSYAALDGKEAKETNENWNIWAIGTDGTNNLPLTQLKSNGVQATYFSYRGLIKTCL